MDCLEGRLALSNLLDLAGATSGASVVVAADAVDATPAVAQGDPGLGIGIKPAEFWEISAAPLAPAAPATDAAPEPAGPDGLSLAATAFVDGDGYVPGVTNVNLGLRTHQTTLAYGLGAGDPQVVQPLASPATDPGEPGPLAVSRQEYNFGDTALTLPNFPGPIELHASITYPTDLSGGSKPLIIFEHGRHSTAYDPTTGVATLDWPPAAGELPIPSYQGYDYLSDVLASDGYIVVSISANGINAKDTPSPTNPNAPNDLGALARAQLIQAHLDILKGFDTGDGSTPYGAPFGSLFVGKIDLQDVGLMGHSRGGEGVVREYQYNQSLGSPYGIKAVLPLAPVDFNREVINNVPLSVMLSYADGDVSDLQGWHYYDDARYNTPDDAAPRYHPPGHGWQPQLLQHGVDPRPVPGRDGRRLGRLFLPGSVRSGPEQSGPRHHADHGPAAAGRRPGLHRGVLPHLPRR